MSNPFDLFAKNIPPLPPEIADLLKTVATPETVENLKNAMKTATSQAGSKKTSEPTKAEKAPASKPASSEHVFTVLEDDRKMCELNFAGFLPEAIRVSFDVNTSKIVVGATRKTPVFSSERVTLEVDPKTVAEDISVEYEAGLVRIYLNPNQRGWVDVPLTILS